MNLKTLKYVKMRKQSILLRYTGIVLALCATHLLHAQGVQRQEKINGLNAYTWYPEGYDTAKVKRWPLILFFPGAGETGTVANKLLTYGPSKFIAEGKLKPNAVVISIQPTTQWPDENTVNSAINAITKAYKVDPLDIHLTGISNGGNAIERFCLTPAYAARVQSVFPVASTEVSALYGNVPAVAKLGLRWYFFCGNKDSQLGRQIELYTKLKMKGAAAELQMDESGHSNFNTAYDPNFKLWDTDINIYDWMIIGNMGPIPPIDTADLQYCVGPADKIKKVIVLLKNGQYQEFDSSHVYIPEIKFP